MDLIATLLMLAILLAVLVAPFRAVIRWQGIWRILAMLPAGTLLFVAGRIFVDTSVDPTSHNLWPLELLVFGVPAFAFLCLIWLLRRFFADDDTSPLPRGR